MVIRQIRLPSNLSAREVQICGDFFHLDSESGVLPILTAASITPGAHGYPVFNLDDKPENLQVEIGTVIREKFGNRLVISTSYGAGEFLILNYGRLAPGERYEPPFRKLYYDYCPVGNLVIAPAGVSLQHPNMISARTARPIVSNSLTLYLDIAGVFATILVEVFANDPATYGPVETQIMTSPARFYQLKGGYRIYGIRFTNTGGAPITFRPHLMGRIL